VAFPFGKKGYGWRITIDYPKLTCIAEQKSCLALTLAKATDRCAIARWFL